MKRALLLIGRLLLAGIFLYAGYAKLREPWANFAGSLYTFKLLPDDMLEPIAKTLPWCEVALGLALLSGVWLRWFALFASLVLIVFLSVLTRSYVMGIAADCGCFGSGEILGPKTLMRDSTMLILALAVTIGAFRMKSGRRQYA
ncbi:MAG: DoxX family membrane protein [Acidobacteriota bacterium]|nr:DoxX family membrane protein [Acidobacteriota bacterium]